MRHRDGRQHGDRRQLRRQVIVDRQVAEADRLGDPRALDDGAWVGDTARPDHELEWPHRTIFADRAGAAPRAPGQPRRSRRANPHAPIAMPPMASTTRGDDPAGVPHADHRLAEMRRQRQLADEVRQAEERAEELHEPGQDDDEHDRGRGEARPEDATDRQADAGQRRRVQAEDQRTDERGRHVAVRGRHAEPDSGRGQRHEDRRR